MNNKEPKKGDLRVWWIPQVPSSNPFVVDVANIPQGVFVMMVLAEYDQYQLDNDIKPDYCNAGGLSIYSDDCDGEGNAGWESWTDEETGDDDPVAYLARVAEAVSELN
jgi:hypothetical protein